MRNKDATIVALEDALVDAERCTADAHRDLAKAQAHEESVRTLLAAERSERSAVSRFQKWATQVAAGVCPVAAAESLRGGAS